MEPPYDEAYLASLPPRKRMALMAGGANGAGVAAPKPEEASAPTPVASFAPPGAAPGVSAAASGAPAAAGGEPLPPAKKPRSALASGGPAFSKPLQSQASTPAAAAAAAAKAKAVAAREAAAAAAAAAAGAAKVRPGAALSKIPRRVSSCVPG